MSRWIYAAATLSVCILSLIAGLRIEANRSLSRGTHTVSTYSTANGERANITLPDGSAVTLNVGSRLDVPSDFGRRNRTVTLTGEALFTVAHTKDIPFVVSTDGASTRVLGTSFVVRRYHTDTAVMVAVREGKVAVGSTIVTAGYETTMRDHEAPQIQTLDVKRFGFVSGVFTVENKRLAEIITDLNRWYDADIRLGDPALANRKVIGAFEMGSIADLKSILELTLNVRVIREGRVLTLYLRG